MDVGRILLSKDRIAHRGISRVSLNGAWWFEARTYAVRRQTLRTEGVREHLGKIALRRHRAEGDARGDLFGTKTAP